MNKKIIFLSFRQEFFRSILYDIKKYEYRKRFCDEPTTAYLYLSSPVRKVIGILELGKPLHMDEIVLNYDNNTDVYRRLNDCLNSGEKYAIPIESLQLFKTPISIDKIKEIEPNFFVPQCYLNLEKYNNVLSYLKNQDMYDIEIFNKHDKIYEDNLAMTCKEMELTDEFIKKDMEYLNNSKYDNIECGYINKRSK